MVKLCTTVTANVEVFALRKTFANFMTCLTKFITIRAVLNRGLEMHLLLQDFNFYFSSSNLNPKANTSLIENFLVTLLKISRSTLTEKE